MLHEHRNEKLLQNLPVILAIFLAVGAIIGVMLWRIKPPAPIDTEPFDKRIAEEIQRCQTLQTKLDAHETDLRTAVANAASAKATMEAANSRAVIAEQGLDSVKMECNSLQAKLNQAQPLVATAVAEKDAAETAKLELSRNYNELVAKHNTLQTKLNDIEPAVAKANAEKEAAEIARENVEHHLHALTQKNDSLLADYKKTIEQASASKTDADHLRMQIDGMSRTIETLEASLTEERANLAISLAKQQSDENAARQFESISQAILKETLEQAKVGVGELTATFQKSSNAELEKHAEKITRTLEPLQAQLIAYDAAVESLKKGTQENYGSLREQLSELQKTERSLHEQAKALTSALSASPKVKGCYGEMILKQLVEFVGMQEKCHFETQAMRETEEGRKIPDLVVDLPGGQKVLVDSKAVMDACVEAQLAQDDVQRALLLKKHCDNVRSRIVDLSSKNYFVDHQDAVEAVVLFLPAENLYATAMENDPGLTEFAMSRNIILCGPNSLMLLLKVSNQLWHRAAVEKEVKDIKDCGEKIYKSACDFVEKFASVGKKIQSLETEYNSAVGTLEGRLLPAGKRMSAFESIANNQDLGEVEPVKDNVREFKEVTRQLAASTPKLLDLIIGDETAELVFATGDV